MISGPVDYGMTIDQTLSHQAQGAQPPAFDLFWAEFREAIAALPVRWKGGIDGRVNPVIIPSIGHVRVAGQVLMPEAPPRGLVIVTHGYDAVPDDFVSPDLYDPWLSRDLAILRIRVRGYPPSVIDVKDLRPQWILHGIERASAWILRGAVGDLVQAFRCARSWLPAPFPIVLQGESFGGGLAVLAAAQLTAMGDPPARLCIGLPSLGDWAWRAGRYCNGAGRQVNMMLEALRGQDRDRLLENLLLFDAALHAVDVPCPCFCKLAQRDDMAPAPSAAAVFNALAGRPKERFVTAFGHFDGGIADVRRHAAFFRLQPEFSDPRTDPEAFFILHRDAFEPSKSVR